MGNLLFLVHPKIDILDLIAEDLLSQNFWETPEKFLIIFPGRRATTFLKYHLWKKSKRPFLSPQVFAIKDWLRKIYIENIKKPLKIVNFFDKLWLLYLSTLEVLPGHRKFSFEEFLPWLIRLSDLFAEIEKNFSKIQDIEYPQEIYLPEKILLLLSHLKKIYQKFTGHLQKKGFITEEQAFQKIAVLFKDGHLNNYLRNFEKIYLAGFYALTQTEKLIFEALLNSQKVNLYLHTPPENLFPEHEKLIKNWQTHFEEIKKIYPGEKTNPEFYFFEAYDLHSEVQTLGQEIHKIIKNIFGENLPSPFPPEKIGIILPDPQSLIPLLHFLPDAPVNITMGYPLKLSPIYTFLSALYNLLDSFVPEKGFYTERFFYFLKIPWLNCPEKITKALEDYKGTFVNLKIFCEYLLTPEENFKKEQNYIKNLFKSLLFPLTKEKSFSEFCEVLEKFILTFLPLEKLSSIEKECIYYFLKEISRQGKNLFFFHEKLNGKFLLKLILKSVEHSSIPFEGDPLEGIQIMGLLETRLLNFEYLFVLDLNEGVLPPEGEINPLLPEEVKKILNLPDREKEREIVRYYFERIISSAKKIYFFWQYSTTSSTQSDQGKKLPSPFLEKIIWEIEKKEKKLFTETSLYRNNFTHVQFDLKIIDLKKNLIPKKDFLHDILNLLQKQPLSASFLKDYITCPVSFLYKRILRLEGDKSKSPVPPDELGTTIHQSLEEFLRQKTGLKDLSISGIPLEISPQDFYLLWEIFMKNLENTKFFKDLSEERKFLLITTAKFRLKSFIENHKKGHKLVTLEKKLFLTKRFDNLKLTLNLHGIIDRVDLLPDDETFLILDYKSGYVETLTSNFDHNPLLSEIKNLFAEKSFEKVLLLYEKKFKKLLQLCFYIFLWGNFLKENKIPFSDWSSIIAGHIDLYRKGEFFYPNPQRIKKNKSLYNLFFENLFMEFIELILLHLLESPYFYPAPNPQTCKWCEYRKICEYSY